MKVGDQRPEVGSQDARRGLSCDLCVSWFPMLRSRAPRVFQLPGPLRFLCRFYPFLSIPMHFLCTFYAIPMHFLYRLLLQHTPFSAGIRKYCASQKKCAHCRRASREKERQKNVRQEDAREPPNVPLPLAQLPRRARGAWSGVPSHGWNMQQTRSVSALCRIPSAFRSQRRLAFVFFVLFRGGKPGRVSGENAQ